MRRSRFSEEQIIGTLKEHQAGRGVAELCWKYGISDATFHKWRSKYGGLEVAEAKRLRSLELENAKLKRLLGTRCWTYRHSRRCWEKTSDAHDPERSGGLGDEGERALAAAGLRSGGDGSAGLPVSVDAAGRRGSTRGSSGDSHRSASTTPSSRHPVPNSASTASSSPIRASRAAPSLLASPTAWTAAHRPPNMNLASS